MMKCKYPNVAAAKSVLMKIGVDPTTRINDQDQDFEYTSCSLEELSAYIDLYTKPETSDQEKRVLGCYFLQCLNEYFQINDVEHPMQKIALGLLHADMQIHETELSYWSDTSDPNEEAWWPIAKILLKWARR